ncbi:hypothetical protein EXU85_19600 [Spirosoma sp. KCTC 42546]|uniref:hypothetical protein n=1 Tax=Spirosoma sp. KCTC 42546 TaxID=2520506 RepID=UPI00115AD5B3|nr:hypothetical protein [Spirosoma sp. KCTC 42546]QDK80692.1 hypothetical protein EXU85_19600 [Spirosoma sp. KCTC 42546]
MEPLNKPERQQAFSRFLGVYCLSLSVPLLAVYLLFSAPNYVLKQENARLNETLNEQTQKLMKRMDGVSADLKTIQTTDQAYLKATDIEKGSIKNQLSGLESGLQQQVNGLKADTAQLQPLNKQLSYGIIGAYDAVLTYRNSITYLRDLLEKKGIDASQVDKLTAALTQARQENEMLKILAAKTAAPAAAAPAPSGGGGPNYLAQFQECTGKMVAAQNRINELTAQLKAAGATIPAPAPVSAGVSRADVEMDIVDRCEKKADATNRPPLWRRPLYEFAMETLEKNTRPDAKQRITAINDKLRRLGSD